ncbi:FaeA/PapI family transcriptional regulator [Citrobacter freundii]|uniref:FaeA/PapI family transcriptional regulator n=1 Tax=Citrobacter freundii TaxID=546 RepID=UPI00383A0B3F
MKEMILKYLSQSESATTAEVADIIRTTDYQARYYLQRLAMEGKVKRSSIRRGAKTQWEIVPLSAATSTEKTSPG